MRGVKFSALLLVGLLGLPAVGAASSVNVEGKLAEAETLRISDIERVTLLVSELADSSALTPSQQNRLTLLQAHQYALKGQYESAKLLLSELFYRDLQAAQELRAYHLLSQIADMESDYSRAFSYLNYALQLLPNVTYQDAQIDILTLAADLFSRANADDKALRYVEQALILSAEENISDQQRCQVADSVSAVYLSMSRYDAALASAEQQLGYCQLSAQRLLVANAHKVIARVYVERLALTQALTEYQKAEQEFVDLDYLYGIINTRLQIGSLLVELESAASALAYLSQVIPEAMTHNLWHELQDELLLVAKLSEQQGDLNSALMYYKYYMKAQQQVVDDNKSMRIAYLQTEFETEQQSQQMEWLEKDKMVLTLREKSVSQQRWLLLFGLTLAVALLLILGLLLARYRQRNQYYRQLSEVDGLTQVFNRRHAYERGERLLKSSLACDESFAVIMADIDHFKAVNDKYGHGVGDQVLQVVANQLKEGLRNHDIIARAGGEEFLLFLPRATYSQAVHIVERCRNLLRPVQTADDAVVITLSFGIAVADGANCVPLAQLVEQADQALYVSKNEGRDRISLFKYIDDKDVENDGKRHSNEIE